MSRLAQARLKQLLAYDPASGVFRWRVNRRGTAKAGMVAGTTISCGKYLGIKVDGHRYQAHRLAWLYVYGRWPAREIDHADTNKLNNSISNLRLATQSLNGANRQRYRNNSSGFKGVWRHGRKWAARIYKDNRMYFLGDFDTPQQAHLAYSKRAEAMYGQFANRG